MEKRVPSIEQFARLWKKEENNREAERESSRLLFCCCCCLNSSRVVDRCPRESTGFLNQKGKKMSETVRSITMGFLFHVVVVVVVVSFLCVIFIFLRLSMEAAAIPQATTTRVRDIVPDQGKEEEEEERERAITERDEECRFTVFPIFMVQRIFKWNSLLGKRFFSCATVSSYQWPTCEYELREETKQRGRLMWPRLISLADDVIRAYIIGAAFLYWNIQNSAERRRRPTRDNNGSAFLQSMDYHHQKRTLLIGPVDLLQLIKRQTSFYFLSTVKETNVTRFH